MHRILIVADDLSGAADCAVACIGSGLSATVVFGDAEHEVVADVLSVDCDTRQLNPLLAVEKTADLTRQYLLNEETLIFKKLDSTLRGNVGVELAAILDLRRGLSAKDEHIVAVMAPAFPVSGRTTRNGQQMVHGRPLHETEMWRDIGTPYELSIETIIRRAGMRSALLNLDLVRSGENHLAKAMTQLATTTDTLICDAETDEDLRMIAEASMTLGRHTIWAGSAGLAYQLPRAAGLSTPSFHFSMPALASGSTLFVIGSLSSVSRVQVEALLSESQMTVISLPPDVLLTDKQLPLRNAHLRSLERALETGQDVVLMLSATDQIETTDGRLLCTLLADLIQPYVHKIGALVVTGGETALSILRKWGIDSLQIVGELEPGLPLSLGATLEKPLPVLTKAGAFGNPQTLLHCQQFLHKLQRTPDAAFDRKGL